MNRKTRVSLANPKPEEVVEERRVVQIIDIQGKEHTPKPTERVTPEQDIFLHEFERRATQAIQQGTQDIRHELAGIRREAKQIKQEIRKTNNDAGRAAFVNGGVGSFVGAVAGSIAYLLVNDYQPLAAIGAAVLIGVATAVIMRRRRVTHR